MAFKKGFKKKIFFLVGLKIVFIFAAANKYSKKDQGYFGKDLGFFKSTSSILVFLQIGFYYIV